MTTPNRIDIIAPDRAEPIRLDSAESTECLADLLARAAVPLNTRCGKRGLCNGCLVELAAGHLLDESGRLIAADATAQLIRACRHRPADRYARIVVPRRSLLAAEPQITTDFALKVSHARNPIAQRITLPADAFLAAPDPTDALCRAVAHLLPGMLPVRLARGARFDRADAADPLHLLVGRRADHWAIETIRDRPSAPPLALAVDIGTTTVVVMLVELETDRRLAEAADFNAQIKHGDNVLTRINHCMQDPANVAALQQALVAETLEPLIADVLRRADVPAERIAALVAAGNTTMLHLLAGVNPAPLGTAPFEPVFRDHRVIDASAIGLTAVRCPVHLLPAAAGYVGADLVGGTVTSGLRYETGPALLVDIGTNGEIILKHRDHLLGCATAAGPAFEGAGLKCGMRAADGAISRIQLTGPPLRITTKTIGDQSPVGLCGSAYIDLLSEARRCGLVNANGRFDPDYPGAPLEKTDYGYHLHLTRDDHGRDLLVTEADLASLIQAKAAIAAGILILLQRTGLKPADVQTVHLAGGFGMNLHLPGALGSGLLPGLKLDQIDLVGNTSLAAAALACWDCSAIDEMQQIRRDMQVVELNLDPDFESTFIDQHQLPEPA